MRIHLDSPRRATAARLVAAALLLVAGAVKLADRLGGGPIGLFSDLPPWLQLAEIEVELGLGGWLLLGFWPVAARWVAAGAFATFAAVSLANVIARRAECGCFGSWEVSPRLLLGVDLLVLVALVSARPAFKPRPASLPLAYLAGWFWASVAGFVVLGDPHAEGRPIALDPPSWVGRRLPVLARIDVGDRIGSGTWKVVFHRHGCPACARALPRLEREARADAADPARPRTALIEVPPFARDDAIAPGDFPSCLLGRLDASRSWRVATPTEVLLRDGRVAEVR